MHIKAHQSPSPPGRGVHTQMRTEAEADAPILCTICGVCNNTVDSGIYWQINQIKNHKHKMESSGRGFILVTFHIVILFFLVLQLGYFSYAEDIKILKPCKNENFKKILLPCDETLRRKAAYYIHTPWY